MANPEFMELNSVITTAWLNQTRSRPKPIPDWAQGKSILDLERMRASKYESALKLLTDGNTKPLMLSPEMLDPNSRASYLGSFGIVSRFAASVARVHFADDDPAGATAILVDILQFNQKIKAIHVSGDIIGINGQTSAFAVLETYLTNLGEADWQRVIETVNRILKEPPPLAQGLEMDRSIDVELIKTAMSDAMELDPNDMAVYDADFVGFVREVHKMSQAQRDQAVNDAVAIEMNTVDTTIAKLNEPEGNWPWPDDQEVASHISTIGRLLSYVDTVQDLSSDEAKNRVQLRLLLVHGLIQSFRLRNNRLPKDLDELGERNAIIDWLAGGKFVYEINGPTYKLYSRGRGSVGRIGLRYREGDQPDDSKPDIP